MKKKMALRFHLTPIKTAVIKIQMASNASVSGMEGKVSSMDGMDGWMETNATTLEISLKVSQ